MGKLKPPSYVPNKEEVINDIRKTVGGAILDPEDLIKDVLDDNDFISIVLESDRPDPKLNKAEIKYVPEQIHGGNLELPTEYMLLDGCSLSTDDLLQLGKNMYKIKLTKESEEKVSKSRALIDDIVKESKTVYGI